MGSQTKNLTESESETISKEPEEESCGNLSTKNLTSPGSASAVCFSPRLVSELNDAATELQKVYKSFRTRRNLPDSAVVVEELWGKALDSAALDRSSVSSSNVEKPEI